jgi:hypothetical protein
MAMKGPEQQKTDEEPQKAEEMVVVEPQKAEEFERPRN